MAYQNSIKNDVLSIPEEVISEHGVVSAQVAELMAQKVAVLMDTGYAVASTGIAGPDGGDERDPVGTIWLAIQGPSGVVSKKFKFSHEREMNIQRASTVALDMLRRQILKECV